MNLTFAEKSIAVTALGLFLGGAAFGASPPSVSGSAPTTGENWRSIQIASEKLEELQAVSGKLNLVGDSIHASMRTLQSARDGHAYRLSAARDHIIERREPLIEYARVFPKTTECGLGCALTVGGADRSSSPIPTANRMGRHAVQKQ
ncbi:MAG TPA: hypothetical protein VI216_01015 [Candidatus Acidoferrales bacterium]